MRVVDLKIEDVAFGGKGVGREQGKAVFVPYTIEGSWFRPKSCAKRNSSLKRT